MKDEKKSFRKAVLGSDLEARLKSFLDMDNQSTEFAKNIKSLESSTKGDQAPVLDNPAEISETKEPQTEYLQAEVDKLACQLETITEEAKQKTTSLADALTKIQEWKTTVDEVKRLFEEEKARAEELTKRVEEEKARADEATRLFEEEKARASLTETGNDKADKDAALLELERTRANNEKERADTAEAAARSEKERAGLATTKAEQEAKRADEENERVNKEAARANQAKVEADNERVRADGLQIKLDAGNEQVVNLEAAVLAEKEMVELEKSRAKDETTKAAEEKVRADTEAAKAQVEKGRADELEKKVTEVKVEVQKYEQAANQAKGLNKEIERLVGELKEAQDSLAKQASQGNLSDNQRSSLQDTNKALSEERDNLQKQLTELQSQSSRLGTTISELEGKLSEANKELEKVNAELTQATALVGEHRAKELEWQLVKTQLETEINKKEIEKSAEKEEELAKEVQEVTSFDKEAMERQKTIESHLNEIEGDILKAKEGQEEMEKSIDKSEGELQKKQKELDNMLEKNKRLKKQSTDQISEQILEIERLAGELFKAQSDLSSAQGEYDLARKEVLTLQQQLAMSQEQIKQSEDVNKQQEKQIFESSKKVQEVEIAIKELTEYSKELSESRDALQQQLNTRDQDMSLLNNKLQELEKASPKVSEEPLPVAETTLDTKSEKPSVLAKQVALEPTDMTTDSRRSELQSKIDEVKANIKEKEKELSNTGKKRKDKKTELSEQIKALKTELADLESEIAKLDESPKAETEQVHPPTIVVTNIEPTESPVPIPEIEQPPVDIKAPQENERNLIDENQKKESHIVTWRMYLEKVIDHIALLDIEMREHNHEIEEIAKQIAESEKFKNCQSRIVEVLKRTVDGIKAIGQQENIDVTKETEAIKSDLEQLEKATPTETRSVANSARAILTLDNPKTITESIVHGETMLGDQISNFESQVANDPLESKVISYNPHEPEQELPLAHRYNAIKEELLMEVDADMIAIIVGSIHDFVESLESHSEHIDHDEGAIEVLKAASQKLQKLLKIPPASTENMIESVNEEVTTQNSAPVEDSPTQEETTVNDSPQDDTTSSVVAGLTTGLQTARDCLDTVKSQAASKREEIERLESEIKAVDSEIATVRSEIETLQTTTSEKRVLFTGRQVELGETKGARERALEEAKKIGSETLHLPEDQAQTTKLEETAHDQTQLQRRGSDHSITDSVQSKESIKRKDLREKEHPSVTVNVPAEIAPDEPISVDQQNVQKLIDDVTEALNKQHNEVDSIRQLKEKDVRLRLTLEKINDNIGVHVRDVKELTEEIDASNREIEATSTNVEARDTLVKLLKDTVEAARKLKGAESTVDVGMAALGSLQAKELQLREDIDKREKDLLACGEQSGATAFATKIADAIRQLVFVAQSGSMGQIKAICYMADLPNVVSDDSRMSYQEISNNLEMHLEDLESTWSDLISGSKIAESLKDYILKAVNYEMGHASQLDTLLNSIYNEMKSRRSARASPDSRK